MFDQFSTQITQILSMTIGGVSVGTIIAAVIYCIKSIKSIRTDAAKNKTDTDEQLKITKDFIEQSFKNAVLPQKIKLDISSKIEKPIKDGLTKIAETQEEQLLAIHSELLLILKILSKFSHTQKLTDEEQEALKEITGETSVEEIKL